jgi:GNAT superfamily N-acetyltransferase
MYNRRSDEPGGPPMFDKTRARFFPFALTDTVIARPVDAETFEAARAPLFDQVFPRWNSLNHFSLPEERKKRIQRLRRVWSRVHHERFIFYEADRAVGWFFGRMEDAITFRMNNTGVLPDHRRHGLYTAFTVRLLAYLKALGYERVISYHHPTNRAILIAKLKLGFNITGHWLSEDSGAVVRLTYFFYRDRFDAFEAIFGLEPDFTQQRATQPDSPSEKAD